MATNWEVSLHSKTGKTYFPITIDKTCQTFNFFWMSEILIILIFEWFCLLCRDQFSITCFQHLWLLKYRPVDQGYSLRKQIGTWRFLSSLIREICIFFLPILGSDEVWLFDKFKEFGTLWVNSSFPDAEASLPLKPHHLRRTKHKGKTVNMNCNFCKNSGEHLEKYRC